MLLIQELARETALLEPNLIKAVLRGIIAGIEDLELDDDHTTRIAWGAALGAAQEIARQRANVEGNKKAIGP